MTVFFRQFQHLLPRAAAWRITAAKTLRSFFEALAAVNEDARGEIDDVWDLGLIPDTTDQIAEWQRQWGLVASGTLADQRTAIAAEWSATGGQSPKYLQDVVQAAGFDLYLHEWWDPAQAIFSQVECGETTAQCGEARAECGPLDPIKFYFVRDPRLYTLQPLIGIVQCGEDAAQCGEASATANRALANEPGYLVNLNLTDDAPPPVPDDLNAFHHFLYWSAQTFPNHATVPADRRDELERLVMKLCPAEKWLVMLVDYV